jgi:hypothetical protein
LNLPFNTGSIVNETDVELTVITPLLTNPNFLDIPAGSIHMYVTTRYEQFKSIPIPGCRRRRAAPCERRG